MAIDERKLNQAKGVFNTLCSALDNKKWKYNPDSENLVVRTGAVGDDLSMKLFIKVDDERELMYLKSPMPFTVCPERIAEMETALSIANWSMLNGCFEMDRQDGYCGFKLVVVFMDSLISEIVCKYLINMSCQMVDKFNDKLLAVAEGKMSIAEFESFAKS